MRRDMDLARRILKELADSDGPLQAGAFVDGENGLGKVCFHFRIMDEAGLIVAHVRYADDRPMGGIAERLTWEGCDFLAAVESDTVWSKVKSHVAKLAGDASLETFKALAVKVGGDLLMSQL